MKQTRIISAFPGTGKSHVFREYNNENFVVLDSDSSQFDKTQFPSNYISHIKENIGKVDIIMVSSHKTVRDALVAEGIQFTLVFPWFNQKEIYIKRYKNRGNAESFIDLVNANWDTWIAECNTQENCEKLVLGYDKYISDILGK